MGIGMILLDTHIWIWLVNGSVELTPRLRRVIDQASHSGLGVSVISCWEVANLIRLGRLDISIDPMEWIDKALRYPGIQLLEFTPEIAVESTLLKDFHKDPADRFLVATANRHKIPILTVDKRIVEYPFVQLAK